jgi:hypothetical protein
MGGFSGTSTPRKGSFAWWREGYITTSQCQAKKSSMDLCEWELRLPR